MIVIFSLYLGIHQSIHDDTFEKYRVWKTFRSFSDTDRPYS